MFNRPIYRTCRLRCFPASEFPQNVLEVLQVSPGEAGNVSVILWQLYLG